MPSSTLKLQFSGGGTIQLVETSFSSPDLPRPIIAIRGKTAGAIRDASTFQWTSAVRALSILCIKSILAGRDKTHVTIGLISGSRGSLASSLDFALSKQPAWIREMFGVDSAGNTLARKLILRTNPERKRPGPVILGLNEDLLAPTDIHIFWNSRKIESISELETLVKGLLEDNGPVIPEDPISPFAAKAAA